MKGAGRALPERPAANGLRQGALVHAVGRLPAKVHTKLLIAFVGIALLVVAVGLIGLRVLGDSNERVGRLGAFQDRANAFVRLETDTRNIKLLLNENPGSEFYRVNPLIRPIGRDENDLAIDQAVRNALARLGPALEVQSLGFVPSPSEGVVLREIGTMREQLAAVMERIIAVGLEGAPDERQRKLRNDAHRLATRLYQSPASSPAPLGQRPRTRSRRTRARTRVSATSSSAWPSVLSRSRCCWGSSSRGRSSARSRESTRSSPQLPPATSLGMST